MSNSASKEKWVIDPLHSEIAFKIRHLMISNVSGRFTEFDASIYTSGDDFMSAEIDCWIEVASVDTGSADRDAHIRSADFFDAAAHPQIGFRGNTISNVDQDGSYELWGDLTIKGVTKKVKFDIEFGGVIKDPWGNEKAAFLVNGKINRKDFGLEWNVALEAGGVLVSDEVRISCDIQLKRSA